MQRNTSRWNGNEKRWKEERERKIWKGVDRERERKRDGREREKEKEGDTT